jgi:hypothetical protein
MMRRINDRSEDQLTAGIVQPRVLQLRHVVLCALGYGLGYTTVPSPVSPQSDAGDDSSHAPLDIPGLSVWLDGEVGVTTSARGVETWVDRSQQEHRFVTESAFDALPVLGVKTGTPGRSKGVGS